MKRRKISALEELRIKWNREREGGEEGERERERRREGGRRREGEKSKQQTRLENVR